MTAADELRFLLLKIGWSNGDIGRRLGCSQVTVRRWIMGQAPVPDGIIAWLQPIADSIKPAPAWRQRKLNEWTYQ